MPDDEDLPILEGRNQVGEEGFDSPDDLSIALAFRKRLINAPPRSASNSGVGMPFRRP